EIAFGRRAVDRGRVELRPRPRADRDRRRNDKIMLAEELLPAPVERGLQRERTRHVERGIAEPLGDVVADIGAHLVRMLFSKLAVATQKCDGAQYAKHLVGMAAV